MFNVILDQFEDIADCACVYVQNLKNGVRVKLHHDNTWYKLSHLLVGDLPDGYIFDHWMRTT